MKFYFIVVVVVVAVVVAQTSKWSLGLLLRFQGLLHKLSLLRGFVPSSQPCLASSVTRCLEPKVAQILQRGPKGTKYVKALGRFINLIYLPKIAQN